MPSENKIKKTLIFLSSSLIGLLTLGVLLVFFYISPLLEIVLRSKLHIYGIQKVKIDKTFFSSSEVCIKGIELHSQTAKNTLDVLCFSYKNIFKLLRGDIQTLSLSNAHIFPSSLTFSSSQKDFVSEKPPLSIPKIQFNDINFSIKGPKGPFSVEVIEGGITNEMANLHIRVPQKKVEGLIQAKFDPYFKNISGSLSLPEFKSERFKLNNTTLQFQKNTLPLHEEYKTQLLIGSLTFPPFTLTNINLTAKIKELDKFYDGELRWHPGFLKSALFAEGSLHKQTQKAGFKIPKQDISFNTLEATEFLENLGLKKAKFKGSGKLWGKGYWEQGTIHAHFKIDLFFENFSVKNISLTSPHISLNLKISNDSFEGSKLLVKIKRAQIGDQSAHNISFNLQHLKEDLLIDFLNFQFAEGNFATTPILISGKEKRIQDFILDFEGVHIQRLIELFGITETHVTGLLKGSIPIKFKKNLPSIKGGHFKTINSSGKIQVQSNASMKITSSNFNDIIWSALKDFRYELLKGEINGDIDILKLNLTLKGINEKFMDAQPFEFNMEVNELVDESVKIFIKKYFGIS